MAHDNGQKLGRLVSNANRSSKATAHAQNTQTVHGKSSSVHGKSATNVHRGHRTRMTTTRGINHASSLRSDHTGFHTMHAMVGMGNGMAGIGSVRRGRLV